MRQLQAFFEEEDAIGVVEIILILVVNCTQLQACVYSVLGWDLWVFWNAKHRQREECV